MVKSWSAPPPKRRSQSRWANFSRSRRSPPRQSIKTKSLPQPCILVKRSSLMTDPSTTLLQLRRDALSPDEIVQALPFAHDVELVAVHQDFRRARVRIVVRRHGEAVRPRAHHRQGGARLRPPPPP